MAQEIPGLGLLTDVPKPVADPPLKGLQLKPEDWFLLSRVDGQVNIDELFLLSPKDRNATIEILKRLRDAGLITLPSGAQAAAGPAKAASAAPTSGGLATPPAAKGKRFEVPAGWPVSFNDFRYDPTLLGLDVPLDEHHKRVILYVHDLMSKITYYQLFGTARNATAGELRRRYFKYSKAFHPDRFFRQDIGAFHQKLQEIFQWINEANNVLKDPATRKEYDRILQHGVPGPWALQSAVVEEPSAPRSTQKRPLSLLLGEAKRAEREGKFEEAFEFYEEALQQRRSAELMNRAAECLIRLRARLDVAEQRARGAVELSPDIARYWVALAFILELQNRSQESIQTYQKALSLDPNHRGARERLAKLQGSA